MALTCKTCGDYLSPTGGRIPIYCSDSCRLVGLNSRPRPRTDGLMKPRLTPRGYLRAWIWRGDQLKAVMVHRWVMEQHMGRPLSPTERVHHISGDRADNRIENLELYSSHSAHLHGEHVAPRVRAHDKRRVQIAEMIRDGWHQSGIARALGVSEATVSNDLKPLGMRARADHFSPSTRDR